MRSSAVADQRIAKAIHMGTELDDIKDLVPHEYLATLERISLLVMEYLQEAAPTAVEPGHWIDLLE